MDGGSNIYPVMPTSNPGAIRAIDVGPDEQVVVRSGGADVWITNTGADRTEVRAVPTRGHKVNSAAKDTDEANGDEIGLIRIRPK